LNREAAAWILVIVGVVYFIGVPLLSTPTALMASGWPIISSPTYPIHGSFSGGYNLGPTATATQTQYVPQTQTQYVTSTQPGIDGANCALALPGGTTITMGQPIWAQVTGNRAGREVIGSGQLLGEVSTLQQMSLGLTDTSGQLYASSPAINVPGLYQITAVVMFGSDALPCVGSYIVTVRGLYISVNPDVVGAGVAFTVDMFSDRPTATLTLEIRQLPSATFVPAAGPTMNQAGHYHGNIAAGLPVGIYVFRIYDPSSGQYSNEEWITIT
jgi:hypothetical protein